MFRPGDLNGFHAADFWSTDLPHSIRQVRSDEALPLRWARREWSFSTSCVNRLFKRLAPSIAISVVCTT